MPSLPVLTWFWLHHVATLQLYLHSAAIQKPLCHVSMVLAGYTHKLAPKISPPVLASSYYPYTFDMALAIEIASPSAKISNVVLALIKTDIPKLTESSLVSPDVPKVCFKIPFPS
mmetsp:Transcript_34582/g.79958  ORF Transcript_34582/g.79958 Transcript_34582/m.79958 type:complete len:115 (-) Transcript_34582:1843-2187(-)